MVSRYELVTSYDEVVENIRQFNDDLSRGAPGITSLSQFHHWYYIPELNAFGPSKFIGYKGMCGASYNRGHDKDGRATEKVLRKWFLELPPESKAGKRLMSELASMLAEHGKSVRKGASVHAPKGWLKHQE